MTRSKLTSTVLVLMAVTAAGQTVSSDSMVQPPALRPPERGSLAGQYSTVAFGPSDVARGGFTLPSTLGLPSERGAPGVNLFPQYSPEGGLSEWGLGWRAPALSLERWRPAGDIDYATDDLTGPWGHLVRGADGAWYASGLQHLVRVEPTEAGFLARLPDGSQWVFDRKVDTLLGTYAWYLTSVVTVTGRRTELAYIANASGRLFLSQVKYAATSVRPAQYEIDLEYESIPQSFSDYRARAPIVLDRRVRTATMKALVDGSMSERWHYSLGYQTDGVGQAFLLSRVQKVFASGATEPAVVYDYATATERLATVAFRAVPKLADAIARNGPSVFQPSRAALLDVDHDGRMDFENAVDGTVYRQLNDTFALEPLAQPAPPDAIGRCRPSPSYSNPPRMLAQMRVGDGEYQIISMVNNTVNTALLVCNRAGQVTYTQSIPYGWNLGPNARLADLNRDRQPDLIRVFAGGYQAIPNESTNEGTAAGISFGVVRQGALTPVLTPAATWLHDMNGDGIVDLVVRSGNSLVVWFGKGDFRYESSGSIVPFFWKSGVQLSSLGGYELTFVDANRDGLADLLLGTTTSASLFVNAGSRFQQVGLPGLSFVDSTASRVVLADLAGSGDTELVLVKARVAYSMAIVGADTGLLSTTVSLNNGPRVGARLAVG